MALRVNHNIMSINAHRQLGITQNALGKSISKLSSGLRIVKASDDAAGLSISEQMRADIRAYNQAVRNANDGVSMLQTAEGALNEISGMLVRMRELAEQAATGTVGTTQKATLDNEFQALYSEINRISDATEFNGTKLVNGALSTGSGVNAATFQIGIGNSSTIDRISISISGMHAASIGLSGISISSTANALTALAAVDTAIVNVAEQRGDIGALQNRLESVIANLGVTSENLTAAESQIRDVDMALEMANFTKSQILVQAGTAMLAQANLANQSVLSLLG
jgi:flagellin